MGVSEWVLSHVQSDSRRRLQLLLDDIAGPESEAYALAEVNDLLSRMRKSELELTIRDPLVLPAGAQMQNQIAAMIELAAHRCGAVVPRWVHDIPALEKPAFATSLAGLRLHLLTHSPPPFRRRNLFVDSSLGDRV